MQRASLTPLPRRLPCLAIVLAATVLLGACAAPAPPVDTRAEVMRSLGFRATQAGWEFSLTGKMLFDHDSDQLDAQSQSTADRLGRELGILRVERVRVEGHTDNVGSAAYNQTLSLRRAQAVANAMVKAGLHDARVDVKGLGQAHPISDNDTPEHRLQNRRVSVIVPAQ